MIAAARFNSHGHPASAKGLTHNDPDQHRSHAPISPGVASVGPFENVADFDASNAIIQEFPNLIAPQGRIRRVVDLRATYEQGQNLHSTAHLRSRRRGGRQAGMDRNSRRPGDEPARRKRNESLSRCFLPFSEGKIVSQRNYDCYPPFESHESADCT